jgi:peptidoglycan pentaglycine glycine transferase (the first glycine)
MGESFLQSNEWLDFQKRMGRDVWQTSGIGVIEHVLPTGKTYFYSPRPNLSGDINELINETKKIAKKRNAIFFKIEPQNSIDLTKYGLIKSNSVQPLQTLILDITKSEEELLSGMHPKMRYNIGLAQKKGIKIRMANKEDDFTDFWRLMLQTSKRDGFKSYSRIYYEEMLEIPGVALFLAEYGNEVIAANIVVFYKNTAIYLHGASDYEHRNLMAMPLLQWHQILEAKKIGCTEYDFWGIDEKKWPGVTRFKRGFNGKEITYPGAYDLVFKPFWYKLYKFAKRVL